MVVITFAYAIITGLMFWKNRKTNITAQQHVIMLQKDYENRNRPNIWVSFEAYNVC